MTKKTIAGALAGAAVLVSLAGPAFASQDIGWTWNSGDHDVQAHFQALGEHVYGYEYNGNTYVDWNTAATGSSRWYLPGSDDRKKHDLNLDLAENKTFGMNVCQYHTAFPDDCSGWKYGVS